MQQPSSLLIDLNDLPPKGKDIVCEEQSLWQKGLDEFAMDVRITHALKAVVTLTPLPEGCLIRGHLSGQVAMPCRRCAEEISFPIAWDFEDFENLDRNSAEQEEITLDEESLIFLDHDRPMLDLGALLWEELLLALPDNPLCKVDCLGICPVCGNNRNSNPCTCADKKTDPRMDIFRTLKIKK